MPNSSTKEKFLLLAILALAAFFRFYRLDSIPPGFQFDQAFNAFDIQRLLEGQFAIFFPANTGREPLYFYLSVASVALFGPTAFAVKLTSAVIGLVTIPLIYISTRAFFSPTPRMDAGRDTRADSIALLAALFAAISFWHIFFSRDGLRVILEVPLTLLVFLSLWRNITSSPVRGGVIPRWRESWVKLGLFLALALSTYPSARLLPLAILFLVAYALWNDRARTKELLQGTLLAGLVAAIVVAPLGIYFIYHPDELFAHTEAISVFDSRVNGGNIPAAIGKNLADILLAFNIRGDGEPIHNLPLRPVFDPLTGGFFLVGVVAMFVALVRSRTPRVDRYRALFLVTWVVVALASSLFSDVAPNFLRMLPMLPPIMILPAWGLVEIGGRLRSVYARRVGSAALALVILVGTGIVYRDYFTVYANLPELYYAFDVDKVQVSDWINRHERTNKIFLAPLWYQQGTISLLTRNARLRSFDSRDTIVLPGRSDGQDALFVFPPEQLQKLKTMAARLGSLGKQVSSEDIPNLPPMLLYRVPAQNLPDPQDPLALARGGAFIQPRQFTRAVWENQLQVTGYTLDTGDSGGRSPTVTLFFHAPKQTAEDYTFSVKVRDAQDRVWGQEDKWPGDNSYGTSRWDAGDFVVERFYPGLNACAPAGSYHVSVNAYNSKTNEILRLAGGLGDSIALGELRADASAGDLYENLEADQPKQLAVSEHLQMFGYTLSTDSVRAGEDIQLALYWRGVGAGSAEEIDVKLGDTNLVRATIKIPPEGRGLCVFYNFTAPISLAPGRQTLSVNDKTITFLNVVK